MEFMRELKQWHVDGRSLVIDTDRTGRVLITPVMPGVVQVFLSRVLPWQTEEPAPSLTVDPESWGDIAPPVVQEHEDHLLARFPGVAVRIEKDPVRLKYWAVGPDEEPAGAPLLADAPEGGLFRDGWHVGARFALDPADRFFGLGEPEQTKGPIPFDHKGQRYPIWNKHLPAPSRLVLPILVNPRGYGLFVDNPWPAEWDLGSDGQSFTYLADGGQIRYYLITGPEMPAILERLTRLTGRPTLPPKWAMGLLQSKFGYRDRAEVEALVETFRSKGIPLDCVILDLFWFKQMGDMAFDRSAFPDPAGMIRGLKEKGVKLIVIEEPYLTVKSRLFPEAERLGLLGRKPDGSAYTFPFWAGEAALVDFTQPLAKQWWADQHKPLMDLGIAGWWTDLNEPEEHPQDMVHHGGVAAQVHNLFAVHMVQAVALAQGQHRPEERLFVLSRSGWPGIQKLGVGIWSGDVFTTWEHLENQIPLGLSMGMSGMPVWNTDIGGFNGEETTPELYIRWMQFGAFTPVMRPHGAFQPREPWAFGEEAEAIVSRYIKLRYQLLPYTYTLAHEANHTGLPWMRPLVLHYPQDKQVAGLRDQYLWGRDLLVAPVTAEGATSRSVYLPEGLWYDFWTNRTVKGGRRATAQAPLDTLPLYVRAGAIIPMAPERPSTGGAWEELTLALYPGNEPAVFDLYEDDGESTAFERGVYATTQFTCVRSGGEVVVTIGATDGGYAGQPELRAYRLAVRLAERPQSVSMGDWRYDAKSQVLHVSLPPARGEQQILIR